MPREADAEGARECLRMAQDDLDFAAGYPTPNRHYLRLCFIAQEAAERAIDAVLVAQGVEVPFIYDLGGLLDLVPATVPVPPEVHQAVALSTYGDESLYPACSDPPGEQAWREALRLAAAVVAWAEAALEPGRTAAA